jgi:hypothetical protein
MNVDLVKCAGIARLPFDSTQIVDGIQYLTFVTFDQDDLFVTGVDFAIQSSAKCDNNLQKILNTSISTVVSSSGGGSPASTIVGISSVPAATALGGGGGGLGVSSGGSVIVATTATATTPSNPATTNFNPKNGNWIKFYQNYYKIELFTKTNNKYTINYEYNIDINKNKKYKYSQAKTLTCNPGKCLVITEQDKIKELDDLPI